MKKVQVISLAAGIVIGVALGVTIKDSVAAPQRVQRKETVGLVSSNVKWGKKNYNPNGQLQQRIQVLEVMMGLREAE